jgi:hypothetical protein
MLGKLKWTGFIVIPQNRWRTHNNGEIIFDEYWENLVKFRFVPSFPLREPKPSVPKAPRTPPYFRAMDNRTARTSVLGRQYEGLEQAEALARRQQRVDDALLEAEVLIGPLLVFLWV